MDFLDFKDQRAAGIFILIARNPGFLLKGKPDFLIKLLLRFPAYRTRAPEKFFSSILYKECQH